MKITKSKLKQIIKESMQDEYKERLRELLVVEPEQALDIARSAGMEDFLAGVSFFSADLANQDLSGLDFTDAVLRHSRFEYANLSNANMTRIIFSGFPNSAGGPTMENANLTGAIMTGAKLYRAELSGADMTNANLTDADLRETDLRGANLTGAILKGADLTGVKYDENTKWPEGFKF